MELKAANEQLIVRYLLGDLPEDEQARLEERAFAERDYLRHIEDAENDLIDEYVRGALNETERKQFESRFLVSVERQKKVEFARALARLVPAVEAAEQPATAHWWEALSAFLRGWQPALQFSLAAAALLLVIGGLWLFNVTRGLRSQLAQLQAEQHTRQQQAETLRQQAASERARNAELAAQLERERAHSQELAQQLERQHTPGSAVSAPFFAALFLPPGIARGGTTRPQLLLPPMVRTTRLQVGLERADDFKRYRVELRTAQGQPVWARDQLRPQTARAGRVIQLTIPASTLSAGQYELTLKGVTATQQTEAVRYYYFDVLKK
ncbi:MAG: hypothetical protein HYR56_02130 [Acidobacteria bacterium]|nr:hypothetical protein [Acidobacteriota bacterium]MBI3421929.1 hypothetical protein [Acidobacteriota bacterium]